MPETEIPSPFVRFEIAPDGPAKAVVIHLQTITAFEEISENVTDLVLCNGIKYRVNQNATLLAEMVYERISCGYDAEVKREREIGPEADDGEDWRDSR